MVYLSNFKFPSEAIEYDVILNEKRKCYNTFYPFQVLSKHEFERIDFETVTILYGGNGSGKSTALNIIAEKIGAMRNAAYNKTAFYERYLDLCHEEFQSGEIAKEIKVLTSDDVFEVMLSKRKVNESIDEERKSLFEDYIKLKQEPFQMKSMSDLSKLRAVNAAKRQTQSSFVKTRLADNLRTYSNGESAFNYFREQIKENGIYILDEPENSLSPELQIELKYFLEDAARYLNCQFIIATHSLFILSMKHAKIYDLDEARVDVKRWTELKHVRAYYDFFKQNDGEFE